MIMRVTQYGLDIVEWPGFPVLRASPQLRKYCRAGRMRVIPIRRLPECLRETNHLVNYGHYLNRWVDNRLRFAVDQWFVPVSSIAHDMAFVELELLDAFLSGGMLSSDSIVAPSESAATVVRRAFAILQDQTG